MDRNLLLALLTLVAAVMAAILAPRFGAESRDGFRRPDLPPARTPPARTR